MSTSLTQYLIYGVKVEYEEFRDLFDNDNIEYVYDKGQTGWIVDGMNGDFAFYGTILLDGQDVNGGDYIIAGEGGYNKVPKLQSTAKALIHAEIDEMLGQHTSNSADYYIVSLWG